MLVKEMIKDTLFDYVSGKLYVFYDSFKGPNYRLIYDDKPAHFNAYKYVDMSNVQLKIKEINTKTIGVWISYDLKDGDEVKHKGFKGRISFKDLAGLKLKEVNV